MSMGLPKNRVYHWPKGIDRSLVRWWGSQVVESKQKKRKVKMITLKYDMRLVSKDNEKIRNKQGRYFLSKKFKDFERAGKLITKSQYKGKVLKQNIGMSITALFKTKVHADCGNLSKGICDFLQGEVYFNDRQIKEIHIKVFEGEAKDAFIVEIDDKLMFAE